MSKVEQLITEHIDIWTSAILAKSTAGRGSNKKYELYGIKKLRELILELAVRGKLVPQDPSDEPASVLLERIAAEKADLMKDGKIKKSKPLPDIDEHEKLFDLPQGWEWSRLGAISETNTGYAFKSSEYKSDGIFVLRVTNINQDSTIDTADAKYISKSAAETTYKNFKLSVGDVLLVMVGGSLGKIGIVSTEVLPAVLNQNIWKFKIFGNLPKDFFIYGIRYINKKQIVITSSTHGHLSQGDYLSKLFPLPPLAEQYRIISKVDELMLLCDQLEQQTETSIDAHATLVEVLLATLTDSADANELAQNWARVSEHFATLFTTEQSIEALKQTLLQLAVMGKLVPQDPNDEPAAVLLEKIAAEKEQLIKDKKIKKEKPLPPIGDDEKPFELPQGWEWVRVGDTGVCVTGRTPKTSNPVFFNGEIPFIGPGQITKSGEILDSDNTLTKEGLEHSTEAITGDILMVCIGGSIGKAAISNAQIAFNQQINSVRPLLMSNEFLFFSMTTDDFHQRLIEKSTGSATPIINKGKWETLLVSVSPLAEQYRIVEKLNELMQMCDQLKDKLQQSQETQVQLTDALIDQALC